MSTSGASTSGAGAVPDAADLPTLPPLARPGDTPWRDPSSWWPAMTEATRHLDPPLGVLSWGALAHNAADLRDRAGGRPIRVASKSVRVRAVLEAVLALPGYAGVLAYTLPEALWLAGHGDPFDDVVVGYPSVDRGALRRLGSDPELAGRVTIMVDDPAQLDVVDAAIGARELAPVRVALELDASYRSRVLGHVGVRRSPVRSPRACAGSPRRWSAGPASPSSG